MRNKIWAASLIAAIAGAQNAVGGLAGQSSLGVVNSITAPRLKPPATRQESRTHSAYCTFGHPNGPGWTCAHVKRMATKRRNRARHKLSVRGRK